MTHTQTCSNCLRTWQPFIDSYLVWRGELIVSVFSQIDLNKDLYFTLQFKSKNFTFTYVVVNVHSSVLLEMFSLYTYTIKQYFVEILMAY